jgi:subtilisin family serine protease
MQIAPILKTPFTPESFREPFAGCTGRGVRVAVIDSGVNSEHPHIVHVSGGVSVGASEQFDGPEYTDHLGHGTAVMAAIQEKAPAAEYLAVKVFDASLKTRTEYVINAIEWAVNQGVDVINLSLGTRRMEYRKAFDQAVTKAAAEGVLLVAAREAHGSACLPGCLPGVLGVGLDWDCPRETYRVNFADPEAGFQASGYPRPLPGRSKERNLNGISFAVANMTGFVVRAREAKLIWTRSELRACLAAEIC